MPECRRCERVLATAELRRLPRGLGYVCLEGANNPFSRCRRIERELRDERRAATREAAQPTTRAEASVA